MPVFPASGATCKKSMTPFGDRENITRRKPMASRQTTHFAYNFQITQTLANFSSSSSSSSSPSSPSWPMNYFLEWQWAGLNGEMVVVVD